MEKFTDSQIAHVAVLVNHMTYREVRLATQNGQKVQPDVVADIVTEKVVKILREDGCVHASNEKQQETEAVRP